MKLSEFFRVVAQVLLLFIGLGTAVVGLAPAGCGRTRGGVLGLAPAADTIRASKLWRIVNAAPKPVALPAAGANARGAAWQVAKVLRVLDGDTYEVQAGVVLTHVRVLGVDCPEHDQPFGAQATDSVRRLVLGKYVLVLSAGADMYGRTLGYVKLRPVAFSARPGVSLDSLLVVRGWAWAYAPSKQAVVWAGLQQQAVAAGRGLWKCGTTRVVRPGIWRAYNAQDKASAWAGCPW